MTGFGKSSCQTSINKLTIEVRALNSKQFDFNCKIPSIIRERENEIRTIISSIIIRGKVDLIINAESTDLSKPSINTDLLKTYYSQIKPVIEELQFDDNNIISSLLRNPDLYLTSNAELSENDFNKITDSIKQALEQLDAFRLTEGKIVEKEFKLRVELILSKIPEIKPFEEQRITNTKKRIQNSLNELYNKSDYDKNRFEQELIYYIEKMDFSEEISRLQQHCNYFINTMNEESSGRKLSFICQEMGREINTLGSKAYDANIQRIVVEMKDELEKIKEQLSNIL